MPEKTSKYPPLSEATKARLDPYRGLMGQRPDGEIAKLAAIDRRYVVVYRHHNDIPAYRRGKNPAAQGGGKPRRFRRSKLDVFRHLMGVEPDGVVAEQAGCSREAVMRYRRRHEIPAAPRGARRLLPPQQPPSPPEPRLAEPEPQADPLQGDLALPPEPEDQVAARPDEALPPEPEDQPAETLPAEPEQEAEEALPPEPEDLPLADPQPTAELEVDAAAAEAPLPVGKGSIVEGAATHHGYLVTIDSNGVQQEFLVIGADIAAAAQASLSAIGELVGGGQVIALRYHAEALI